MSDNELPVKRELLVIENENAHKIINVTRNKLAKFLRISDLMKFDFSRIVRSY